MASSSAASASSSALTSPKVETKEKTLVYESSSIAVVGESSVSPSIGASIPICDPVEEIDELLNNPPQSSSPRLHESFTRPLTKQDHDILNIIENITLQEDDVVADSDDAPSAGKDVAGSQAPPPGAEDTPAEGEKEEVPPSVAAVSSKPAKKVKGSPSPKKKSNTKVKHMASKKKQKHLHSTPTVEVKSS